MRKTKILLLVLFLMSSCFCVYKILEMFKELDDAEDLKEELIEIIDIPDIPSEEPEFKVDFDELRKINPDVVGWIVIEGTQVSYPIVQGKDNSYYLNHSYDKKWSGYGSIFMDYNSTPDFSDFNTFIYGHSTKNGTMFGELYKYMNIDFYNEHPTYYLYTPNGNYSVEIFSVYETNTDSEYYNQNFSSLEDYKNYLELITSKSRYSTEVEANYKVDKIITLYSCSKEINHSKSDRYFIHGILKKTLGNQ